MVMKLTVLGSGPSFPNPGGATSGYLIEEGETRILLEAGHGIASVLPMAVDPRELSAIVISHMHPDHYLDLVPLTYAYRFHYQRAPIPLLLPPQGLATFDRLWEPLELFRDHFLEVFEVSEYKPSKGLSIEGLEVAFAHTEHFIPAYAMRFSSRDGAGSLGYSSDTEYASQVVDLLRGVSLALVEATYAQSGNAGKLGGHLTAASAGRMAREAGVERLLLTHFERSLGPLLSEEASRYWGKQAELAEQLKTYEVSETQASFYTA
jgi:ribonuclease BN (tRNA processing enzyme)